MARNLADFVRRHDPDRFLAALFAPADHRDALLTLYAFNHELARAREMASMPMLALIRLQWWREVVDGTRKRHEVAEPVHDAIQRGVLARSDLLELIDAREIESDPTIPTRTAWRDYLAAGAGGLAVAGARALGADQPETLRPYGTAYGLAGVLRSARLLAREGRCLLPEDVLGAYGLTVDAVIAEPASPRLTPVLRDLAADGLGMLESLPRRPQALAATLPAVLAARDLRRVDGPVRPRGIGDRLAVVASAATGRLAL